MPPFNLNNFTEYPYLKKKENIITKIIKYIKHMIYIILLLILFALSPVLGTIALILGIIFALAD